MLRSYNQDIYRMAVEFNTAASCIMDLSKWIFVEVKNVPG